MGYTHYFYRPLEIPSAPFLQIKQDLLRVVELAGVPLAGPHGTGKPVITKDKIAFNGVRFCGHQAQELGVTWPARPGDAPYTGPLMQAEMREAGWSSVPLPVDGDPNKRWFAGALLDDRSCDGECSYETFWFPRVLTPEKWDKPSDGGKWLEFCKTAYRPYDLIVTAALIIMKHHLGDMIIVQSDGEDDHPHEWADARRLCQDALGYGADFLLDPSTEEAE